MNVSPSPSLSLTRRCLELVRCYEDVDPGQKGGEGPLSQQLHLHINKEVLGLTHLSLKVDGTCKAVELPCAEVAFLVAPCNADDDLVSRVGGGGADAEDLGRDDYVGLEAELVVGDPQRRALAVQGAGTAGSLTAPARHSHTRMPQLDYLVAQRDGNELDPNNLHISFTLKTHNRLKMLKDTTLWSESHTFEMKTKPVSLRLPFTSEGVM